MIENMGLVSKERMMEVYLNIIEWGPGLYGAGEACDFYFGKKPAALSVEEAIYLASIIPMPKYYKSRFQHDGNLKPDALNYIRLIRNKMVSKGMITPADTLIQSLNFRPEFIKSHIVLSDSVQSPEVSN
jgi:membrane peptidoglycan carboxypeptidase